MFIIDQQNIKIALKDKSLYWIHLVCFILMNINNSLQTLNSRNFIVY